MPFLTEKLFDELLLNRPDNVSTLRYYRIHALIKSVQLKENRILAQLLGTSSRKYFFLDISLVQHTSEYFVNLCSSNILCLCKFENSYLVYENADMLPLFIAVTIRPLVLDVDDNLTLFHFVVSNLQSKYSIN